MGHGASMHTSLHVLIHVWHVHVCQLPCILVGHLSLWIDLRTDFINVLMTQSSQVSADSNINSMGNKPEEKVGEGKYSSHSLEEVAGMIRQTLSAYEAKVFVWHFDNQFLASSWTIWTDISVLFSPVLRMLCIAMHIFRKLNCSWYFDLNLWISKIFPHDFLN